MGHELIGKVRLLSSFGSTELNDDACVKLSTILGNMRFAIAKGDGQQRLTREQARALRITAREHFGWDSIALAIALRFEVPKLHQADVIGEWVPLSDPAKSEIMKGSEKWIRGLRRSDLDSDMVLHRTLPGRRRDQQKEVTFRLSRSQMTMEEINRIPAAKRNGAMIICEFSNLPWSANEFRRRRTPATPNASKNPHKASVSINTVTKLLVDAGIVCAAFHDVRVRGVKATKVQCDEIWSFSYSKAKNIRYAKAAPEGAGDVWTWTGIEADSKLIVGTLATARSTPAFRSWAT